MLASSVELQQFLVKHKVGFTILEIIDEAILKAQSGNVTIHPYGFYILKPVEERKKQIRIHVWLSNVRVRQDPDWPPHNHNFDLDSIVVKGRLRHNIWLVKKASFSKDTLYEVSYDSESSRLKKMGQFCTCDKSSSALYLHGNCYNLPKYTYHSVDVNHNENAVTLCVMTNPGIESQFVVGDIKGDISYEFTRKNVSAKECDHVLQLLIDIRDGIRVV